MIGVFFYVASTKFETIRQIVFNGSASNCKSYYFGHIDVRNTVHNAVNFNLSLVSKMIERKINRFLISLFWIDGLFASLIARHTIERNINHDLKWLCCDKNCALAITKGCCLVHAPYAVFKAFFHFISATQILSFSSKKLLISLFTLHRWRVFYRIRFALQVNTHTFDITWPNVIAFHKSMRFGGKNFCEKNSDHVCFHWRAIDNFQPFALLPKLLTFQFESQ